MTFRVPTFQGADTLVSGQYQTVVAYDLAIRQFADNEAYGTGVGLTFWWLGSAFNDTLTGDANLLVLPNLDAANILFNVLKMTGGHGVTIGPILLGHWITLGIFMKTLFGGQASTIQFPEQKRNHSGRYRGVHLLTVREDGSPKCVACESRTGWIKER
jgi:hypothetical protein